MTNKQKLSKLRNIYTDLGDDASHVLTVNAAIQAVADDFEDLFSYAGSGSVKTKIEGLKEQSQSSDSNIQNARSYCQYEINRVSAEVEAETK